MSDKKPPKKAKDNDKKVEKHGIMAMGERAGIFNEIERSGRLSELGDPLEKLSGIDRDLFVPMIGEAPEKTD